MGRSFCYRCHKALAQCICQWVPNVKNQTPVWILQHFRERFHPIGTARFAVLGLEKCEVVVAHSGLPRNSTSKKNSSKSEPGRPNDWTRRTLLTPMTLPEGAAVLFPSEKARPLSEVPAPSALLVLDATWSHAKRLYYENPWISELPHVSLSPKEPSRYRIRKEPAPHCLSTLEAIVLALSVIEPDTKGFPELLRSFDLMIDQQSSFVP